MKRIISLLITAALLANGATAFAKLTVTGPNISGELQRAWLEEMQADNLVGEILDGNIAFVTDCDRAWVYDSTITMSEKAEYISDTKEFMLPVETVNQIFGLNESGTNGMISSVRVEALSGKNVFIDPRGFILFSDGTVVNTSVPANYNAYRDFYTVADAMGYIAWEDREFTEEERAEYIRKWRGMLSLPDEFDRNEYSEYIETTIKSAKEEMAKVSRNSDGSYTFDGVVLDGYDLTGAELTTFKGQLSAAYGRLLKIATGYVLMEKDSADASEARELILGGIEFLLQYYSQGWNYSTDSKQNWTLTQFNLPITCSNLLCLMYDDMTDEERIATTNQIFDKSPIPNVRTAGKQNNAETYTNRLWRCFSYFNTAVIANDTYRMNYALKYSAAAFMYSPRNMGFDELKYNKDGFYPDGSMIFHSNIPYNMGYGLSYSVLVYELLEMTKNTKFDIRNIYGFDNVYEFCTNNLLPFLTNEMMFKMVVGRGSVLSDTAMLRNCAYIANNAPEEQRRAISAKIKEILDGRPLATGSKQYIINTPYLETMREKYETYAGTINASGSATNESRVFYNQDQIIHSREDFTAAISMSSTRIGKYEGFPPNNSKGWYLGDGMLYVYTDNKQYNLGYFNNVNPYYMPGTTVDSTVRQEIKTDAAGVNWGLPNNDWAGGVTDGENTVAGYELGNKYVSNLEGRKSYFLFGDKIICMGTGISGGEGNAYTVVENRIIDKPSDTIKPIEAGYTISQITTNNPDKAETIYQIADGNINTSCSLNALDDWIVFDLGEKVNIGFVGMAFLNGDARSELATIQVSDDGVSFTDVKEFASSGESKDIELYDMNCSGRYFKIISHGNSRGSAWFNLAEIIFYKDTATAEQIEESKNIISEGYDDLVIDSVVQEPVFNSASPIENPGWVWLEDQEGFVFLEDAKLNVMRERNPSSETFMRISIEHGERPVDAGYAYVQLPKATQEETMALAESNDIEILERSAKAHAVYDRATGLIGANIFQKGAVVDGITFNTPCAVLIDKPAGRIYVSEPTWSQKRVSFTLPETVVNAAGAGVTVSGREVLLDTSVKRGSTHAISCRFTDENAGASGIKVMDYHLRASAHFITTTLFAASPSGNVSFEIAAQPQAGRAMIFGNTLYYYASGSAKNDSLVVRAKDSSGNYADFSVTITE